MKRLRYLIRLTLMLSGTALSLTALAWGVWGHQHINHAAVFALPQQMRGFYFDHIDYLTMEASVPDIRKYTPRDPEEGPRHFIDLEDYSSSGIQGIPHDYAGAVQHYGKAMLQKDGSLPWYILYMEDQLTQAFKDRDPAKILYVSADLAHYIGDAYMPLHTTANYDGQLSGQRGVHALWESMIPERFGSTYNFHTPAAHFIQDPQQEIWRVIQESHDSIPRLLATEKQLLRELPDSIVFEHTPDGSIRRNRYGDGIYSSRFVARWNTALGTMVEDQMRKAITEVSSFWYTAWVNAGKPDLTSLDPSYLRQAEQRNFQHQFTAWSQGHLIGIPSQNEP